MTVTDVFVVGLVKIFLEANQTLRLARHHLPRMEGGRKDGAGDLYNTSLSGTDHVEQ